MDIMQIIKKKSILYLILPLLIISIGFLAFNVGNTFQVEYSNNIIDENELGLSDLWYPITINSPDKPRYTSGNSAYIPGTYSFHFDSVGSVPQGWTEYSPGAAYIKTHSGVGGHSKILQLYDPWHFPLQNIYAQAYTTFSAQPKGTIEFWFRSTAAQLKNTIYLKEGSTTRILFRVYQNKWQYHTGSSWTDVSGFLSNSVSSSSWYHLRIDFESTFSGYAGLYKNRWKLTFDGDVSSHMEFYDGGSIDTLLFTTDQAHCSYSMFIDAVGFSWDPGYYIGDNQKDGLFLDITPDDLTYLTCTLDSQVREIPGDTYIPFPDEGSHTLQVYGEDSTGLPYFSDPFYFDVYPAGKKIVVFFWASDALLDSIATSKYTEVFEDEGYSKFFYFKDTNDFDSDFASVDDYEVAGDIIFFYMCGHGGYENGDSSTDFKPGGSRVYSSHFRTLMDGLETIKKGFLIDSCHSGGWVEDFNDIPYYNGYLAISSTNIFWTAMAHDLPGEGYFSNWFFYRVANGDNYLDAFNWAYNTDLNVEEDLPYFPTFMSDPGDSGGPWIQYPLMYYDSLTYNFFAS